ncbi:peroxide stress protein YaaA [Curtobacterium flaccumfaciens]|nr:peroxide stress protein YaaA [Curtobacterium flaccumfaciens]
MVRPRRRAVRDVRTHRRGDLVPAYRLSHDSRLGPLRLASHWPAPASRVLETRTAGHLVLDLRSEGYRQLGPVSGAVAPRVVSVDGSGRRKALNHWNKTAKGRLLGLLARTGARITSMTDLLEWSSQHGVVFEQRHGGWDLVAESLEPVAV